MANLIKQIYEQRKPKAQKKLLPPHMSPLWASFTRYTVCGSFSLSTSGGPRVCALFPWIVVWRPHSSLEYILDPEKDLQSQELSLLVCPPAASQPRSPSVSSGALCSAGWTPARAEKPLQPCLPVRGPLHGGGSGGAQHAGQTWCCAVMDVQPGSIH